MATVKASVVAALKSKGLTAESDQIEIKKAFFSITSTPLSKAVLPVVVAALAGDLSSVTDDSAAPAPATKTPKEKKAKEPAAPKPPKVAETPEAALARLKGDPQTAERWSRVTEVLEMGKKGPTRVRIKTDDAAADGSAQYRDIKIQDLFQVKFSVGYKKPRAAKPAAAAPASE